MTMDVERLKEGYEKFCGYGDETEKIVPLSLSAKDEEVLNRLMERKGWTWDEAIQNVFKMGRKIADFV